jgi:O-antigen ligase
LNPYLKRRLQELGESKFDLLFALSLCLFAFSMILSLFVLQIAAVLVALSWLLRIPFDSRYRFRRTAFDVPVLLLLLVRVLSVFLSVNVDESLEVLWKEVPFYALYFALAQNLDLTNQKLFRALLICFLAGGTIGAVHGIYIHLTKNFARAQSTTSGYMTFGMYLTAVLTVSLPFADILTRRRYLYWSLFVLLFATLLLTLNRTHTAIAIMLFVCFAVMRERRFLLAIAAIFLAAVLISPKFLERIVTYASPIVTSSGRSVLWSDAWGRLLVHPFFGYGPHTFRTVFTGFDSVEDKLVGGWHNDYLQLPLESGFGALLLFIWIMIRSLCFCFRHKPWREKSWEAKISLGTGGMLIAFYVSGFFGASAQDVITSQLYKFALAVSALLPALRKENEVSPAKDNESTG